MMRTLTIVGLISLLIWGCAPTTTLTVLKPAEIDTYGIERLAVLDFRGPESSGKLAGGLFSTKLFVTQHFKLVEREELVKVMNEQALGQTGALDDSTVVQVGKILGVDALIVGDVTAYRCEDKNSVKMVKEQVWTGDYEKNEKGNFIYVKGNKKKKYEEKLVPKQIISRSGTVTVGFRLIDVKTGEIRAIRTGTSEYSNDAEADQIKNLKAKEKVLTDLMDNVISGFAPLITPHYEKVNRQFARDGEIVDQGIEFGKKNLWDKAQNKFEQAIQKNSKNHAAYYNLGLTLEVQGNLEGAENEYNRAVDLKSERLYMEALANIRKAKADREKLKRQMEKKKSENTGQEID